MPETEEINSNMTQSEIENVLANIAQIPEEQLAKHIVDGAMTLKQMMDTGELIPEKRRKVEALVEEKVRERQKEEEDSWNEVRSSRNINEIEKFILRFPSSKYVPEANELIKTIKDEVGKKERILKEIKNRMHDYKRDTIIKYIEDGTISRTDLLEIGVPSVIVENLNEKRKRLEVREANEKIPDGYTEVYFWGIPGSGKTCILSSIINVGEQEGLLTEEIATDNTGGASFYIQQIRTIFKDNLSGVLPLGTNKDISQYMPFNLKFNDKKRPVALVDLSGEVFKAFTYENTGESYDSDSELTSTFNRTLGYLKGPNKKLHFFIVDLNVEPDTVFTLESGTSVTHRDFLKHCANFLHKNQIFRNSTNLIAIIASKSDKLSKDRMLAKEEAIGYLKNRYNQFNTPLKEASKSSGLGNEIPLIPYTLGDIYFEHLCVLEKESPLEILNIIKKYSAPESRGFLKRLMGFFSNN